MNVAILALAAVFLALSTAFLAQAKKEDDGARAQRVRLTGWITMIAGSAMLVAGAVTLLRTS